MIPCGEGGPLHLAKPCAGDGGTLEQMLRWFGEYKRAHEEGEWRTDTKVQGTEAE